jgi:tetratricopeptide (TPR) repeat protein
MKITIVMLVGCLAGGTALADTKANASQVPITTSSEDARALYLKARDLGDKLRITDAHALYAQAIAKDANFALAYLGLANTSGTTKEFFEALAHAVALADKASPGEQEMIRAADFGAKADPPKAKAELDKLVKAFPNDARVHNLVATFYFGRLDYPNAIASFEKAIKLDPAYSQPYNQLGYAYRFTDKPADAERTFKKYIELIPDDPNPYDSYGELLMEEGKFDESIKSYEKALAHDPNFVASYIGIANDQMFQGKTEDARKTLARFTKAARNDGERRTALMWTAMAYVHDGAWDKALAELDKMAALATAAKDLGNLATDTNLIATTLLEAGRPDEALAKFKLQVETSDKSDVPAEVKEFTHRNFIFDEAWVAVVKGDLATAKSKATAYGKAISPQRPFEVRQLHELNGLIAIAEKQWKVAITELGQATPHDPRIYYLTAVAQQGAGDMAAAKRSALRAASFNGLALNYPYVRAKAKTLAGR